MAPSCCVRPWSFRGKLHGRTPWSTWSESHAPRGRLWDASSRRKTSISSRRARHE